MNEEEFIELIGELGKRMAQDPEKRPGLLDWKLTDTERSQKIYKYIGELALTAYEKKADLLTVSESLALKLVVDIVLAYGEGATPAEAFYLDNHEGGQPKKESRKAFAKMALKLMDKGVGYNAAQEIIGKMANTKPGNVKKAIDQHRDKSVPHR